MIILPAPRIIRYQHEAEALLPRLLEQEYVSVDTETNGTIQAKKGPGSAVDRWRATVDCWSLSFDEEGCPGSANRYALVSEALFWLEDFFLCETVDKVFHNALFDLNMLSNSGIPCVGGVVHCTQILDAIVDENRFGNHGLKECSWDYLGLIRASYKDLFGSTPLRELPIEEKSDYASEDTWTTHLLFRDHLQPMAEEESLGVTGGQNYTVWDFYMRYIPEYIKVIFAMQRRGWRIDTEYLGSLAPQIQADIDRIDRIFNQYAVDHALTQGFALHEHTWERGKKHKKVVPVYPNGVINPGSDDQLAYFLIKILGLPILEWTDGGKSGVKKPRMNEEVLQQYASQYGCNYAALVLQRRKLKKVLSTYIQGMLRWVDDQGRIHASLKIMGARTGRLSCTDPNLQNIPKPEKDEYQIRKAFIAAPGHKLIVADYKTLEMRILAHMSACSDLCAAIDSGQDLHCLTAARMFGVDYDDLMWAKRNEKNFDLSPAERDRVKELLAFRYAAKAIGFGIAYGRGAPSLANVLECSVADAEAKISAFFATYPGVKRWLDQTIWDCKNRQPVPYVQTWLLRKRRLLSINSRDKRAASEAERQAVNAPIQGTAADMVMIVMLSLERDEELRRRGVKMLMQVHDELIFECPEEIVDWAKAYIQEKMEEPFRAHFRVQILTDIDHADNWAEAK